PPLINIKKNNSKTLIKVNFKNNIYTFNINLIGQFQIENLYQSIILALSSGLKIKEIFKVLEKIKPIEGRLNIIKNRKKTICIDYAHTPDGLKKVIETLKNHYNKKVNIVFGCGGNRDTDKRKKMGQIANKLCNKVILTNDNPREEDPKNITRQIFQSVKKAEIIHNRKLAIKKAIKITKEKEVLLIAGKGHENYQIFKNKIIYFSDFDVAKKNLFI
ncbi:glutamate ligase domain-containing protein, partial [Candidatus Pelagibacter sp. HIMB1517]|uniref:glutamate ligase domain-containing protein n=1 Tax=Candidatus Pelagibacter sp. HIMB1517 TaxID=3413341 RepID=UPI003F82A78D